MPLNTFSEPGPSVVDALVGVAERMIPMFRAELAPPSFSPFRDLPDERCDHRPAPFLLRWRGPCPTCKTEADVADHAAWLEGVEQRLGEALDAAAAGHTADWHVWPLTDEQTIVNTAAAEFGFTPWTVRRHDYNATLDGVTTHAEREAFLTALMAPLRADPEYSGLVRGDRPLWTVPTNADSWCAGHGDCNIVSGHVWPDGRAAERDTAWVRASVNAMTAFTQAMRELVTSPGVSLDECEQVKAALLAMAGDVTAGTS